MLAKGQSKDALAFLKRAIQLQPNDWTLYSAEGVAYDQFNDYPDAQLAFAQALSLKPGDPTVLNNSAMSHLQAGDIAGAEWSLLRRRPRTRRADPTARSRRTSKMVQDFAVDAQRCWRSFEDPHPPMSPPRQMPLTPANPATARPVAVAQGTPAPAPAPVMMAAIPDRTPAPIAPARVAAKAEPKTIIKVAPEPAAAKQAAKLVPAVAESSAPSEGVTIFVQAGAYGSPESAGKVAQDLSRLGARVSPMVSNGHAVFRVRIGPFHDSKEADAMVASVQATGHADVKVVRGE